MSQVSIGLPVFNGENYLALAIESLLAQSYEDFELIISDNASEDGTASICRDFAARDKRIRYYRNKVNLGAAPNFNQCVNLATGSYFKWAAHDDVCLPDYLRVCVRVLDRCHDVVLCHTLTRLIDARGRIKCDYTLEDDRFSSADPIVRFSNAIANEHGCVSVFGLMRRDILLRTPKIANFVGSDRNLIAELALYGRIVHVPEIQFLSRDHDDRSVRAIEKSKRGSWFNTMRPVPERFQLLRVLWELVVVPCPGTINGRSAVKGNGRSLSVVLDDQEAPFHENPAILNEIDMMTPKRNSYCCAGFVKSPKLS